MSDLAAKARRAAEWWRKTICDGDWEEDFGEMKFCIPEQAFSQIEMVKFAEDRGWQDQDSKPPEFVGVKGVESAAFNQEQEADGVEWNDWQSFGDLAVYVHVPVNGEPFWWEIWCSKSHNQIASGTAPTRAEARAAAVEAARGMG